jgi:hypothetical protein
MVIKIWIAPQAAISHNPSVLSDFSNRYSHTQAHANIKVKEAKLNAI